MTVPTQWERADWPEAMATVTECRYDVGALRSMAFGLPTSRRFVITFNYWADGELRDGEYRSAKAIPQGTLFPIRYDPAAPEQHDQHVAAFPARGILVGIGLLGSVVLMLLWLALSRRAL